MLDIDIEDDLTKNQDSYYGLISTIEGVGCFSLLRQLLSAIKLLLHQRSIRHLNQKVLAIY